MFRSSCGVPHRHVCIAAYDSIKDRIGSLTAQRLPPGSNGLSDVRSVRRAVGGAVGTTVRNSIGRRCAWWLLAARLEHWECRTCTCECRAASTDSAGAARRTGIGVTRRVVLAVAAITTVRAYIVGCRTAAISDDLALREM